MCELLYMTLICAPSSAASAENRQAAMMLIRVDFEFKIVRFNTVNFCSTYIDVASQINSIAHFEIINFKELRLISVISN